MTPENFSDRNLFVTFADQTIEIRYPNDLAREIEAMLAVYQRAPTSTPRCITVSATTDGRFAMAKAGDAAPLAQGLQPADVPVALLAAVTRALVADLTSSVALNVGAVAIEGDAVLILGDSAPGEPLVRWFVRQGFASLSETLALLSGETTLEGFPAPTSGAPRERPAAPSHCRLILLFGFKPGARLSVEVVPAAIAAAELTRQVMNAATLPGRGISQIATLSRAVPALRVRFGGVEQLGGVIDTMARLVIETGASASELKEILDVVPRPAEPVAEPPGISASTAEAHARAHAQAHAQAVARAGHAAGQVGAVQSGTVETVVVQTGPGQASASSQIVLHTETEAPPPTPRKDKPVKLTIGMATFDDYDGVYFTIQSLRLNHSEILDQIEFLVIDNNPTGRCATALKSIENWIPNYRYVPEGKRTGTAIRDRVFAEADGEFVLCMDCHVLVVPGALRRLLDYFEADKTTDDLLQGPMLYDDLKTISTHFEPKWSDGMWGVWETDQRGVDPNGAPFDIPMQGLGLFACRRAAWPGFNRRFRGFGGEEGYIHEKFRQRGGRTLCLPFLRWLHRFERPMGTPYPNNWADRIRNYMIGFREIGYDATGMIAHFRDHIGDQEVDRIMRRIDEEMGATA